MSQKRRLNFKDIPGLKFIAVLPIFCYCIFLILAKEDKGTFQQMTHFMGYFTRNSIDFFFFLSAFLITANILREYKYEESFSLRKFLIRRLIRITPLLGLLIIFGFVIHPWIGKILKLNALEVPGIVQYFKVHLGFSTGMEWAIEQKYYLAVIWFGFMFILFYTIWGVIMKFFRSNYILFAYVAIALGILARIYHVIIEDSYYYVVFSYGIPIGMGVILAKMIREENRIIENIKQFPKSLIVMNYFVGLLMIFGGYILAGDGYLMPFIPIFTCIVFMFVILEQTYGKSSLFKLRNNKPISHLGKLSYGIVVYQSILNVIVLIVFESLDFNLESKVIKLSFLGASSILTWIVSDISYSLIERPLNHYRREFKRV